MFNDMTILDFETTGLKTREDGIIEVAAIRVQNGKQTNVLSHLINPEVELPAEIMKLTGIAPEELSIQPTMSQFLPWLLSFIGDSLIVAHNALFDFSFLDAANQRHRGKPLTNDFLCTCTISRDLFPYKSGKLIDVCGYVGVKLEGAHRALNDINATYEVLQKFRETKGDEWVAEYVNRHYYFAKWGKPEWAPEHAKLICK